MKKILVTGAAGYIGSVLVRQLLEKGYMVRGLDGLFFGGESILGIYNNSNFEFIKGDIRDTKIIEKALEDIQNVIHLASIVGDPACAKQPGLANEINWVASKYLYDECNKKKDVEHFIFASTCSNYGKMEGGNFLTENSELRPISLYAELKVKFEKYILESSTRDNFIPTALRFSTVYGVSPRMRFDLTVNEFIREVALEKELIIFGEQFWRPYCHVEDLANACITVLEAPKYKVRQNVFGVGDSGENYQKKMIAEEIIKIEPNAKIKYIQKDEDPRDYRVDFSKIKKDLGYKINKTVPQGLKEVYKLIKEGIISDPYSAKYRNI